MRNSDRVPTASHRVPAALVGRPVGVRRTASGVGCFSTPQAGRGRTTLPPDSTPTPNPYRVPDAVTP